MISGVANEEWWNRRERHHPR